MVRFPPPYWTCRYGDDLRLVDDYARPWVEISALVKVVGKSTIELAPIDILGGTETKICHIPTDSYEITDSE
jgi:hypothetical protein